MTIIDTSTASTATAYSNQRKIDRCQNGVLWAVNQTGGGSWGYTASPSYSTDNGATWTPSSSFEMWNGGSASHAGSLSFFIDVDDFAHVVYKDRSDGIIKYRRGTPNAARTSWTWSSIITIDSAGVANKNYPDVIAHKEGTGWRAHVVWSHNSSGFDRVFYTPITITSGGGITVGAQEVFNTYSNSNHKWPSIDFHHTGDGKTISDSTPHLYVAWSAGAAGAGNGIRFRKATYSGGSWTWGTEREIDNTRFVSSEYEDVNCLFDGTRVIIVGEWADATPDYWHCIYERDADDTTTTTHLVVSSNDPGDWATFGNSTYDNKGNIYLSGHDGTLGPGERTVVVRKWTRSTGDYSVKEVITTTGPEFPYVSLKRGFSSGLIEFIYTHGTSSPYSVTYGSFDPNDPPNAPALTFPSDVTIDRTILNQFTWTFDDSDVGDTQSKFDLQIREQGQTTPVVDVTETTSNEFYDLAADTLTLEDDGYEWRVRTYDQNDAQGEWSVWTPFRTFILIKDFEQESSNEFYDLPADTVVSGNFEWRVVTWDDSGEQGPWSGWNSFTVPELIVNSEQGSLDEFHDLVENTIQIPGSYEWRIRTWDQDDFDGEWSEWGVFDAIDTGLRVYTAQGWIVAGVRRWNGTDWVIIPVLIWNGSEWTYA